MSIKNIGIYKNVIDKSNFIGTYFLFLDIISAGLFLPGFSN
jgi:hypothetical protein